jgi:hypothetical protein
MSIDIHELLANGFTQTDLEYYQPQCIAEGCSGSLNLKPGENEAICRQCGQKYLSQRVNTVFVKPVEEEDVAADSWKNLRG